jgi:hypothetical protein
MLTTDVFVVEIAKDLDTNDVVYTRIECPVKHVIYGDALLNYTYSMGNSLKLGAVLIVLTYEQVLHRLSQ